jgi:hypothetical protein
VIQEQQIASKAKACGISKDTLTHLLANRIGKSTLDVLTKAEAALFLAYLRSPGTALSWSFSFLSNREDVKG